METTITFVLGALCGLFLLGMVYAFIGVLKMQKQIKNHETEISNIYTSLKTNIKDVHKLADNLERELTNSIDEILRDLEQQRQDDVRRSNDDYQNLRKLLDDTNRYVDKRVDHCNATTTQYIDKKIENTVDALCTRMDLNQDQLIKS